MSNILVVSTLQKTIDIHFNSQIDLISNENNTLTYASNIFGTDLITVHNRNIPFSRNQFSVINIVAFLKLKSIIRLEKFDFIITQTPIASAIVRLLFLNKNQKKKPMIIYIVHGFHFQRGYKIIKNASYFIEKFLSRLTDVFIVVNSADFITLKNDFRKKNAFYVNGVGIKTRPSLRLHISDRTGFRLISVGELNRNKNHELVIKALEKIDANIDFYYDIYGTGPLNNRLQKLIDKFDLSGRVRLMGYSSNISQELQNYDCFIFPSYREGLGIAALEAMASGLPVIASINAGTMEYISNEISGLFFEQKNPRSLSDTITRLINDQELYKNLSKNGLKVAEKFMSENVITQWSDTFKQIGIIKNES